MHIHSLAQVYPNFASFCGLEEVLGRTVSKIPGPKSIWILRIGRWPHGADIR